MEKFNSIKQLIDNAEKDADAFFNKGNSAAGTRLRSAMQNLKVAAGDIRKEVISQRNAK